MSNINLSNLQAGSGYAGLQVAGPSVSNAFSVPSTSYTAGQIKSYAFSMVGPSTTKIFMSNTSINITGASTGISGFWIPISGAATLIDNNASGSGTGAFTMSFQISPAMGGRTLTVYVKNATAGSTLTFPGITVNASTYFYTYPW